MEDNQIDRIFSGNFESLPPIKHPLVRIYTSSTYTDMTLEKTVLVSEVYPKLKEYCRERYGLEFQVVDMRWGVRDEATDDHMTTSICLEEIRNCQEVSMGPNFVFLGGQKYGYRPIPNVIECDEFDSIVHQLEDLDREDTDLLNVWYEKDTNSLPPVMILQPISSILPNFMNKLIPEKQEEDQKKWWETLCKLQKLLRDATTYLHRSGKMSEEAFRSYHVSVIEKECEVGLLKVESTKNTCLAFLRKITNINMTDTRGGLTEWYNLHTQKLLIIIIKKVAAGKIEYEDLKKFNLESPMT